MKLLLSFAFLVTICHSGSAAIRATLNGAEITDEEIRRVLPDGDRASLSQEEQVEKVILYKLAVSEAKKMDLQNRPEVQAEVDRALYKAYLKEKAAKLKTPSEPTELAKYYEDYPMVRLRHLFRRATTPAARKQEHAFLSAIQLRAKKGESFEKLVMKYSAEQTAFFGGDTDFRGMHQLPPEFYNVAKKLNVGEISPIIESEKGLHLVQLVAKMPFDKVPPGYRLLVETRFQNEREKELLQGALADLRQKAEVKKVEAP